MASRSVYHKYRRLVEALGLRQVDVYRVVSDRRPKDIVRVADISSGKVFMVDLGTVREALGFREFMERILEGARGAGIHMPDKLVSSVLAQAERMDAGSGKGR